MKFRMNKELFKKKLIHIILVVVILVAGALRLISLDKYQNSMYSDEISQGYNAYSVLKTGRDEYGTFLPISFRSFGDWKPPMQTYLMVPTIALFGLNAWGVRLPSAILGTVTVYIVFLLTRELIPYMSRETKLVKYKETIALISSIYITLSPWHILQSRSAMLVAIALFFFCFGFYSLLKSKSKPNLLFVSSVSFALCIYSYYGMRVIVPLFLLGSVIWLRNDLLRRWKFVIGAGVVGLILLSPLFIGFIFQPDVVFGRARTVSIFYDKGVTLRVADLIAQDGPHFPSLAARYFHNKPYHYITDIARRFLQHLDGTFLFLKGDFYDPFQIPGMGILYLIDGLVALIAMYFLKQNDKKMFIMLLLLMALSLIPASLTFVTPSTNRTFNAVLPISISIAIGLTMLLMGRSRANRIGLVIIGIYVLSFGYFSYQYFWRLPYTYSHWWHYGYKELFAELKARENKYNQIIVTGQTTVSYVFQLFYQQIDPATLNQTIVRNYQADAFGFEHVDAVGKYEYPRQFDWRVDKDRVPKGALLAAQARFEIDGGVKELERIYYPNGKLAYTLYEKTE